MVIYSSVCGHGRFKCVRNRLHKRRQNWQLLKYCVCNYVDYADLGVFLAHTYDVKENTHENLFMPEVYMRVAQNTGVIFLTHTGT